jgi:hypothetical protein
MAKQCLCARQKLGVLFIGSESDAVALRLWLAAP